MNDMIPEIIKEMKNLVAKTEARISRLEAASEAKPPQAVPASAPCYPPSASEAQGAVAWPLSARQSGPAALLEIIKACEDYQNADFEGMELEQQCDEGYRCSMKVITIASAALQELEARQNEKADL